MKNVFGGLRRSAAAKQAESPRDSWKKKYEEEAKSKFNLLLQVQEQQRIIQRQNKLIDDLRSQVKRLGGTESQKGSPSKKKKTHSSPSKPAGAKTGSSAFSKLQGGASLGVDTEVGETKKLNSSPLGRVLRIHTSGFEKNVPQKGTSPANRSAPTSPAGGASRRKSWGAPASFFQASRQPNDVSPSNISSKTTAKVLTSPLSPALKAANLEFGRRRSFKIITQEDWLKNQRIRSNTASSPTNAAQNKSRVEGSQSATSPLASSSGASSIGRQRGRAMTMDEAAMGKVSTFGHLAPREALTGDTDRIGGAASEPLEPGRGDESALAFENFFVAGVYPTTNVEKVGVWQPEIIYKPSKQSVGPTYEMLADFCFPEGVESFYVGEGKVKETIASVGRHCFMMTDSNQVYYGFCLTMNQPVLPAGAQSEEQFYLYADRGSAAASPANGAAPPKPRCKSEVDEADINEMLEDLGDLRAESPTPFLKPDIGDNDGDAAPKELQKPTRLQFLVPNDLPENRVVTITVEGVSCQFSVPENSLPGTTILVELPSEVRDAPIIGGTSSDGTEIFPGEKTPEAPNFASVEKPEGPQNETNAQNTRAVVTEDVQIIEPERDNAGSRKSKILTEYIDEPENWNHTLFVKRVYCFVSKQPLYDLHFQILERIAALDQVTGGDGGESGLEERRRSLVAFIDLYQEVALRGASDGDQIIVEKPALVPHREDGVAETWPLKYTLRPPEPFLAPSWAILTAFRLVSFENIVALIGILLMEKSVAIVSSSPMSGYAITYALSALLSPFEWQATFIPCLPCRMWNFLLAPVPFLVGMTSMPKNIDSVSDVAFLLVDSGELKHRGAIPLPKHDVIMSSDLKKLRNNLCDVTNEGVDFRQDLELDGGGRSHGNEAAGGHIGETLQGAMRAVHDFVEGIAGDVRVHCIRNIDSGDVTTRHVFLRDSYLERRNAFLTGSQTAFVKRFVDTQLFTAYVDCIMENEAEDELM